MALADEVDRGHGPELNNVVIECINVSNLFSCWKTFMSSMNQVQSTLPFSRRATVCAPSRVGSAALARSSGGN